ncbi:hypothetical protein TWF694_005469 [Orbilia ellipsospora]|uniref:Uncharacterized protein n=1 Tax=Orbilia ellipsospora TaxID=2528407 RepID=A0AAV9WUA6_9PEZI
MQTLKPGIITHYHTFAMIHGPPPLNIPRIPAPSQPTPMSQPQPDTAQAKSTSAIPKDTINIAAKQNTTTKPTPESNGVSNEEEEDADADVGVSISRASTPSPPDITSCPVARQISYADTITVQTVFVDNVEDMLDELVFRIFSTTILDHLLNKIERYRGLPRDSCVFYHHGRVVSRAARVASGMVSPYSIDFVSFFTC